MGLRDQIQSNGAAISAGCVVVMVVCLFVIFGRSGHPGAVIDAEDLGAWYYVPATGDTFVGSVLDLAPIASPDGEEAVRAYYFACGACTEGNRFVGYYEKYPEAAKQKAKQAEESGDAGSVDLVELTDARLVSSDGQAWHSVLTDEGRAVLNALNDRCPQGDLTPCRPGRP